MTLTQAWEVRTTLPNEAVAIAMAKELVESKLAACVHISGPIRSIYKWENALQAELEWTLAIKTLENFLQSCTNRIAELHPYEVPEILSNPIHKLSDAYHQWLQTELTEAVIPKIARLEPWHLQIQTMGTDAVKFGTVSLDAVNPSAANPSAANPSAANPSAANPSAANLQATNDLHTCDQWSQLNGPSPLRVSFETLAAELTPWVGMHFEMDGSFVWVSSERDDAGLPHWQLDGMIYDRNNAVQYVELKGRCDRTAWIKLVAVLDPTVLKTTEPMTLATGDAPEQSQFDSDDRLVPAQPAASADGSGLAAPLAVHLIKQSAWILESEFRKTLS